MIKKFEDDEGRIVKKVVDNTGTVIRSVSPVTFKNHINIGISDGEVANDGTNTETITISVVDGLEVARGTDPANATVLDYDGDVTVSIEGAKTTKTLSNGTVSFDLTTDKPAGSTITVTAESLTDHPSESDSATIEVRQ